MSNWYRYNNYKLSASDLKRKLNDLLLNLYDITKNPATKKEIDSIFQNKKDINYIISFLKNNNIPIPPDIGISKELHDWQDILQQSTTYKSGTYIPSVRSLTFSANYFPEKGVGKPYSIFIPALNLLKFKEKSQDIQNFINHMGSLILLNPEGTYVAGHPDAWKRFLDYSHVWYPKQYVNLDNLYVNDVSSPEIRKNLNPEAYSSMSVVLSRYGLGHEITMPEKIISFKKGIKSAKILPKANFNTTSGVKQLPAMQVEFFEHDPILSEDLVKAKNKEMTNAIGFDFFYVNINLHSIFLPLNIKTKDSNFKNLVSFRNYLQSLGYTAGPFTEAIKFYDSEQYKKYENKAAKETAVKSRDIEELEEIKEKNERKITDELTKTVLKNKKYEYLTGNPQIFIDTEEVVKNKYALAFDKKHNTFLAKNPEISDNIAKTQLEGIAFGVTRQCFVLADQPGAGKTISGTAIADFHAKINDEVKSEISKILVISPSQLINQNWIQNPPLKSYIDPTIDIQKSVQHIIDYTTKIKEESRWIIISFDMFKRAGKEGTEGKEERDRNIQSLIDNLRKTNFSVVLIDEAQIIKNVDVDMSKNVLKAIQNIDRRIAMSGTPSDNSPGDLYGLLSVIDHPILYKSSREKGIGYRKQTRDEFCVEFFGGYGSNEKYDIELFKSNVVNNTEKARVLLELMEGSFLRRERQDINPKLKELHKETETKNTDIIDENGKPIITDNDFWDKQRSNAVDSLVKSKTNDEIKKLKRSNLPYNENEIFAKRKNSILQDLETGNNPSILIGLDQKILQQTALMKTFTTAKQAVEHIYGINELGLPNKVLILTGFIDVAEKIKNNIEKLLTPEIREKLNLGNNKVCDIISGGIDQKMRGPIVEKFKNPNDELKIIIFTIETGAIGYNFQMANLCIFNDYNWNPSKNSQGEDRIKRLTSELKPKVIYNVIPDINDSEYSRNIDERMYKIMSAKKITNEKIHSSLRESFILKKDITKTTEERENRLNELSRELSNSLLQSMILDENARKMYSRGKIQELRKEEFSRKAAFNWFNIIR